MLEGLRVAVVSEAHREERIDAVISSRGVLADSRTMQSMVHELDREVHGLGALSTWAVSPGVTDILVNGSREVWIDDAEGLRFTGFVFDSEAAVRRLAVRLAATASRRIDDASPWVDARLPNGMRLHAILHPLSRGGSAISLRLPASTPFTLDDLECKKMFDATTRRKLLKLVRSGEPLLLSGGTGTGKTTLLSALLAEAPKHERIVVAEDSAELTITHPHVVYLEGRPPNIEGAGAVTLRDLVKQSLRMRPDRLIVGEVRGAEVLDLLNALNTGHSGGAATVHANSASDALVRLELLALQAGLGREAAQTAIATAFRTVIHIERGSDGKRRVRQIASIDRETRLLAVA